MKESKKLRFSTYSIVSEVPDSEYMLLLHGLSGAIKLIKKSNYQDIVEEKFNKLSDFVKTSLVESFFLTTLNFEEEEILARSTAAQVHEDSMKRHPGTFVFIPTYVCSFRCPYCFQSHSLHKLKEGTTNVMTKEQVDSAFSIIQRFREAHPRAKYNHLLFGGEPLMDITKGTVNYILDKSIKNGDRLKAITNGYELEHFSDILGPDGLHTLQITLDGDKDTHDLRRFAVGRTPTFDKIIDNIYMALEKDVTVNIRVNVDKRNLDSIGSLSQRIENIKSSFDKKVNIGLSLSVVHGNKLSQDNKLNIEYLVESFGELSTYYQKARKLVQNSIAGKKMFSSVANCSSQLGMYIFDPRWDVYTCWEQAGIRDKKIGTYSSEGDFVLDDIEMGQWFGRHPGAIDECGQCKYIFICKGGCAHHAEKEAGTMYVNHCEGMKKYMPMVLGDVYSKLVQERN